MGFFCLKTFLHGWPRAALGAESVGFVPGAKVPAVLPLGPALRCGHQEGGREAVSRWQLRPVRGEHTKAGGEELRAVSQEGGGRQQHIFGIKLPATLLRQGKLSKSSY